MSSTDTIAALCMGPITVDEVSTDTTLDKVASLRLKVIDRMLLDAGTSLPGKGELDTLRGLMSDAEKSIFQRKRITMDEGTNNSNNKLIHAIADNINRAQGVPGSRTEPVMIDMSVLDAVVVDSAVTSREHTNMTAKDFLNELSKDD